MDNRSNPDNAREEQILALKAQIAVLESELATLQSFQSPAQAAATPSEIDFLQETPTRIVFPGLQRAGLILQSILEQPLVGIEIVQDGMPVFTNQALADLRGFTLEEIRSFTREEYWGLVHPDFRSAMDERFVTRNEGQEIRDRLELLTIRKDGSECWFEVFVTPIAYLGKPASLALFVDATKRKHSTERLLDREQRLSALFQNSMDTIILLDNDGVIVEANPAAAGLFGRPIEELIGERPVAFARRKDEQDFERIFGELLDAGARDDVMKIERPDGTIGHAEYRAKANYMPGLHVAFMRDITGRVEAEAARSESERAFKSLAENMPDLITRVDHNLNYTYVNPAMAKSIGRPIDTMIGASSIAGLPDAPATRLWAETRRAVLDTGKPQSLNFSVNLPEGTRHFYALLVPEFDDQGNVETVLSVNREVTEAKIAEERVRQNEAFIRDVTDNVPYLIVVYSSITGDVVFANQTFKKFIHPLDQSIRNIARNDIREHVHPDDLPLLDVATLQVMADPSDDFVNVELRLQNPEGEWRWMKLWISVFKRTLDGKVEQFMGIAQDITEQRHAQQQTLKLALEEERVRVLTDFIHAASHEFRTPLSSINTALYMLNRLFDDEKAATYLERIETGSDQILILVEALLQLSELDGIQQLELRPMDIQSLAETIIERFDHVVNQRNITLSLRVDENVPPVLAHLRYLTTAISHLVDNAFRYTPDEGTVIIDITTLGDLVHLTVADNGIGMSPEVQSQIFQRFFRLDAARSTRGLGLGLPSVEKIIELHGGMITVDSIQGEGSAFTISLKALTPEAESAHSESHSDIDTALT